MEKTVKFRGNSPELNKPLPTGIMAYNPEKPIKNVPYTLGEQRAAAIRQTAVTPTPTPAPAP